MSEQTGILETLIAALNANTAALKASGSATAATAPEETAPAKKAQAKKAQAKKAPASEHSRAEATEAVVALKDAKGAAVAKKLLADHGFAKLADITEDKYDELYDAAVAAVEEDAGEGGDDDI